MCKILGVLMTFSAGNFPRSKTILRNIGEIVILSSPSSPSSAAPEKNQVYSAIMIKF